WFKKLICQWGWGKNDYDNLSELCYLKYEGYSDGSTWSTNHNVDLLCNLTPNTNYSGSWEPTTSTPSKPGIQLQTLIQDDFGQYSQDNYTGSATGRITIVREGWARFHFRMGFVLGFFNCATLSTPTPNYGYRAKAFLRLKHNSTIIASGNTPNVDFGANYNGQKEWRTVTIHSNWIKVSVGDTIHAEAKANGEYLSGQSNNSGAFSVCGVNVVTSNKSYIEMEFDGIDIHIGDQFSLKDATPCDIKQTDFIKSIAHMFNLYFYTDVTSKTVYIEPFDTFYQGPSNGQNWDAKIDWSKSIEDKFNIGLKREMLFKYKNDSKDKYQQWINDDMVTGSYPLFSYYTNLGTMFEDRLKKFENPLFSGTMMEYDKDTSGYVVSDTPNLIPVMEKEQCSFGVNTDPCVGRPDKDRFAPRILVYNGYTTNGTFSTNRWTRKVGTSTFTSSQTFPRGVFVDIRQISTLFQNRINLSYNDETHDDGSLTPGLVSNYWTNMIVQLMEKPRTRTMYINLKLTDILNLNLTKLVYIDGSWWRLIKVIDFAPAKNETTKVELIQWIDVAPGGNTT
ncbi:MAG TPA: hypothetical protein DCS66_01645, partial [Flavobacteriaceae bacterium]|nr:hypothetical protein [Flavobacteriaceae bacterium]